MKLNSMYLADGYKISHFQMYKDGTEVVYSNFTPRSNKHAPAGNNGKVLNFGQSYAVRYIVEHFNENFFSVPKEDVISDIKKNFSEYLGVEYDTAHIEELHDLGYLPLQIRSLTEGTESAIKIPILFLYNTDIRFAWVTNYIETILSNLLWQPITTATNVLLMKRIVKDAVDRTDKGAMIDFTLHDFSMRGLTGLDAAIGSGMAFAAVSKGSDSLPVIKGLQHYYGASDCQIYSVRASEHSQMTADGVEGEFDIFKELLTKFPDGILSLVSDSFNLWRVLTEYLPELKDLILSRNGKFVVRPDSGDPVDIICGTEDNVNNIYLTEDDVSDLDHTNYSRVSHKYGFEYLEDFWTAFNEGRIFCKKEGNVHKIKVSRVHDVHNDYNVGELISFGNSPASKGVIELLWDVFGGTVNEQGFKVLNPKIGMIYGEAINQNNIKEIYARLEAKGFAASNAFYGQGSFSVQFVTRDTWGMALKCIAQQRSGTLIEIFKDPITDDGIKKSAKGLTVVYKDENGEYYLKDQATLEEVNSDANELKVIFEDNIFYNQPIISEIRERINSIL